MKWFKMHTNLHRNVKVQSLPGEVVKTWLNLLSIYGEEERFPSTQQILFETRMPEETYLSHLDTLLECGLFDSNEQGQIQPHDWHEYNPKILSTDRVQKHRALKRSKQVKRVKHVASVSPSEKADPVTAQENVSCVSCDVSPFLSDFQKNAQNVNGTVKHVSSVSVQHTENKEVIENILESEKEVKRMKHLKHPRLEEIRLEEIRKEENTHPYTPLSNFDEYENEQTQPGEKNSPSVFAESLNGNGKHPKAKNSLLTPKQQVWFDSLWADFWRKNDKHPAEKAFSKHIRSLKRFEELQAAFERDRADMLSRPVDKRPCLGPWVNKEPWRDDDLSDVPQQVKISPKEAASEAVYREYLAELENKGKTQ